jgi:phosphomethylpyrimidine synthase
MKITQDLRQEAQAMTDAEAQAGMRAKSEEFKAGGGKLYVEEAAG